MKTFIFKNRKERKVALRLKQKELERIDKILDSLYERNAKGENMWEDLINTECDRMYICDDIHKMQLWDCRRRA